MFAIRRIHSDMFGRDKLSEMGRNEYRNLFILRGEMIFVVVWYKTRSYSVILPTWY